MNLYLIKPYENWSCCGGGGAIVAQNEDELSEVLSDETHGEKLVIHATNQEKEYGFSLWEIVEILPSNEQKCRVIFIDYNWG